MGTLFVFDPDVGWDNLPLSTRPNPLFVQWEIFPSLTQKLTPSCPRCCLRSTRSRTWSLLKFLSSIFIQLASTAAPTMSWSPNVSYMRLGLYLDRPREHCWAVSVSNYSSSSTTQVQKCFVWAVRSGLNAKPKSKMAASGSWCASPCFSTILFYHPSSRLASIGLSQDDLLMAGEEQKLLNPVSGQWNKFRLNYLDGKSYPSLHRCPRVSVTHVHVGMEKHLLGGTPLLPRSQLLSDQQTENMPPDLEQESDVNSASLATKKVRYVDQLCLSLTMCESKTERSTFLLDIQFWVLAPWCS